MLGLSLAHNPDHCHCGHTQVQALLTEKFDPLGSYEYSSKVSTFSFWLVSATAIYCWWLAVYPLLVMLRPFSGALIAYSNYGKVQADTRRPWHVPYNRWEIDHTHKRGCVTHRSVNRMSVTCKVQTSKSVTQGSVIHGSVMWECDQQELRTSGSVTRDL